MLLEEAKAAAAEVEEHKTLEFEGMESFDGKQAHSLHHIVVGESQSKTMLGERYEMIQQQN